MYIFVPEYPILPVFFSTGHKHLHLTILTYYVVLDKTTFLLNWLNIWM